MSSDIPFPAPSPGEVRSLVEQDFPELRTLFHQLNNQLGIILANAELLDHGHPSFVYIGGGTLYCFYLLVRYLRLRVDEILSLLFELILIL